MATYILLLTFTPEGRERMLHDPDGVQNAVDMIAIPRCDTLGLYAVLGEYDFVNILSAPDNESAARFSVELGVHAGVHVTTLPAIPVGRLDGWSFLDREERDLPESDTTTIDDS